MSFRVLLIEDDARLAGMVVHYLGEAGFRATVAATGAAATPLLRSESFDAVILDLMLPDMDGLELCKRIRAESSIPLLMLTARGDPLDRVVGLELGADDYLPKPFEPRELLARLRAILRRQRDPAPGDVLRFGRLEIDRAGRLVRVDGEAKPLTGYQYTLLVALAERFKLPVVAIGVGERIDDLRPFEPRDFARGLRPFDFVLFVFNHGSATIRSIVRECRAVGSMSRASSARESNPSTSRGRTL